MRTDCKIFGSCISLIKFEILFEAQIAVFLNLFWKAIYEIQTDKQYAVHKEPQEFHGWNETKKSRSVQQQWYLPH